MKSYSPARAPQAANSTPTGRDRDQERAGSVSIHRQIVQNPAMMAPHQSKSRAVARPPMSTPTQPPSSPSTAVRAVTAALLAAVLGGCATSPNAPQSPAAPPAAEPVVATPVVQRPFPREALYGLLVAEFAIRRGALDIALQNYLEQAQATRDAGVAARGTRMARYLGAEEATLRLALLWSELEPQNPEARFTAATALARAGRAREAFDQMHALPAAAGPTNFAGIAASALDLPQPDREEMLAELQRREAPSADVLIASGLLLQSLERNDEALASAERVLADDPDNFQALLLSAQVHHNLGDPAAGNAAIERALQRNPDDRRLRLQYARLLARSDLAAAEEQFRVLLGQDPADAEVRLALALVYRESGQFDRMSEELNTLLAEGNQTSAAHFYLAQDAERREDSEDAIRHYLEIRPGPTFMAAATRAAELLIESRGLEELGSAFVALRERWSAQALPLTLLESELRVEQDDLGGAARLLDAALAARPDEPALLYARSLVSERRGDLAALERDLRHMLRLDPQNALALNALGYSLANLTPRHAEALELIGRALALRPDDPAIIDSMGWVLYRLGRHDEALVQLRRAFEAFPDHEVAAHLGEVLWMSGAREEAREVWRQGLQTRPDSRLISDTMRRLGAEPSP